ncbi:MAG: CarD family transcriptional regulator [Deltaproteobacteria bacterium]|nr:MAG: CarD family transcriptional regulator [Deltaproteobacteria bacterium]
MFKVGDLAVYPAHGVGVIEKIETREVSGCSQNFYVMRILDNDMIIMIPTSNAKSVGLRDIIEENEIPKLYSILKQKDNNIKKMDKRTWNRRYREHMEKIKTGSVYDVAEVYRDLAILGKEKELSFGEKKLLNTAKSLLIKEISVAKNMDEEEVKRDLESMVFSE